MRNPVGGPACKLYAPRLFSGFAFRSRAGSWLGMSSAGWPCFIAGVKSLLNHDARPNHPAGGRHIHALTLRVARLLVVAIAREPEQVHPAMSVPGLLRGKPGYGVGLTPGELFGRLRQQHAFPMQSRARERRPARVQIQARQPAKAGKQLACRDGKESCLPLKDQAGYCGKQSAATWTGNALESPREQPTTRTRVPLETERRAAALPYVFFASVGA